MAGKYNLEFENEQIILFMELFYKMEEMLIHLKNINKHSKITLKCLAKNNLKNIFKNLKMTKILNYNL